MSEGPHRDRAPAEDPDIPLPPWSIEPGRRSRRYARPALDRQRIVDEALAMVDAGGLEALTIRGVAARLGVAPMSIYWHVRDKAHLCDLVGEAVLSSIVIPPRRADWREDLRAVHRALRVAADRHPNATELMVGRARYGRAGLGLFERILEPLLEAGFTSETAFAAYDALYLFLLGYVATATRTPDFVAAQREGLAYLLTLPDAAFPAIHEVAPVIPSRSPSQRFETGLDVVLDGIAALLAPTTSPD
jgi:AcrR family transcriptional regulator